MGREKVPLSYFQHKYLQLFYEGPKCKLVLMDGQVTFFQKTVPVSLSKTLYEGQAHLYFYNFVNSTRIYSFSFKFGTRISNNLVFFLLYPALPCKDYAGVLEVLLLIFQISQYRDCARW